MSLHDAYARVTPFELAFPDGVAELSDTVDREAAQMGADGNRPAVFVSLPSVGRVVAELGGEGATPETDLGYSMLAYHAVQHARAGANTYLATVATCRYLVDGPTEGVPTPPAESGYLQLPQHLFWADRDGRPESVDGIAWTVDAGALHTMVVGGVGPDREGVFTVRIPEAPLTDASAWLHFVARPDGDDYASSLPGAELDVLYAFETAGEVLKLVARLFVHLEQVPDAAVACGPADAEAPAPSRLPHLRVSLRA